jgi:hypothetical protein
MASAKLEILISAKDAASQVMGRVKGAFALRAMEIQGLSQQLVKNGEKVEKFLHGISLLKMATETESFKTALAGVSPTLQKTTSDLLNMGVAIGGTLSLAKDLAHVLPAIGMKGVGALAATAAIYAGGKWAVSKLDEESDKTIRQANQGGASFGSLVRAGDQVLSQADLMALITRSRAEHAAALKDGNAILANGINDFVRKLLTAGDAMIEANKKANAERAGANAAARQSAAMEEIKAMRRAAFEASPQGRLERIKAVSADLDSNRRFLAAVDPEKNAPYWLTLNKTVQGLNEELDRLKSDAGQGKISDLFAAIREGAQGLLRRRTGGTTTTNLGPLPGSAILSDSLSRQGLFAGGGRANPLTGLTDRTLVSIDSATKEQVRLMRGIWQALTKGNLDALTE